MPTDAIAIFAKTPALTPVKTRLAASLGTDMAEAFFVLALDAVEDAARQVAERSDKAGGKAGEVGVFLALAEEEGPRHEFWNGRQTLWTGPGDLGARQHRVYEHLLESHDKVLLIGADIPQITAGLLEEAFAALASHDYVLGPATDGGFYLFGGRAVTEARWWAETGWSAPTTRDDFTRHLPKAPALLAPLSDVDEAGDLAALLQEMAPRPGAAQRRLLEWLNDKGLAR